MKINVRILLITFIVVVLVSASSTLIYYSLTNKILHTQQTKSLLNSANDFIFALQQLIGQEEEELKKVYFDNFDISSFNIESTQIDFAFFMANDSLIKDGSIKQKQNVFISKKSNFLKEFLIDKQH